MARTLMPRTEDGAGPYFGTETVLTELNEGNIIDFCTFPTGEFLEGLPHSVSLKNLAPAERPGQGHSDACRLDCRRLGSCTTTSQSAPRLSREAPRASASASDCPDS